MENNFWYFDNWSGAYKGFDTLREAIASAKEVDGISVTVYCDKGVAKIVQATGYVYP